MSNCMASNLPLIMQISDKSKVKFSMSLLIGNVSGIGRKSFSMDLGWETGSIDKHHEGI